MVLLKTPYTNPFGAMNDHLIHSDKAGNAAHAPVSSCVSRTAPMILRHVEHTQQTLMETFGFRPAIFEPHVARFTKQVITVRKGWKQQGQLAVDVRYRWSNEYYHFLTEALPNALLMTIDWPGVPISCAVAPFTVELFRWFGLHGRVIWAGPSWHRVQCAFVECGNPSPEKIASLRGVVTAKLQFKKTLGILIRRQRTRRILNEPLLLDQLRERYSELEWVVFDHLSVDETALLFSRAAVIAGPHGAGFTNMLFSGPGTKIIEFMPLEQPNLCYWHLSEMLGNSYFMIPTKSDRTRSMVVDSAAIDLLSEHDSSHG
jgi:hypothetical protein